MLLLDVELRPRMCTNKGDYIKMLVSMAPSPFTHIYQLVMTSALAQKEFMLRVDMHEPKLVFVKLELVVTKWSWNVTQSECVMASSNYMISKCTSGRNPGRPLTSHF
jgi:hypothetical protein